MIIIIRICIEFIVPHPIELQFVRESKPLESSADCKDMSVSLSP